MKKTLIPLFGIAVLASAMFLPAAAATSYTLFGDAEIVALGNPGNAAQLVSDAEPETDCGGVPCGGVDITGFPTDPAAITALSFDYNSGQTGASGGSPRLVVRFDDGGRAELRPLTLTGGAWVTIDGMTGTMWDNNGGSCGFVYGTDWATVLSCHAGASIDGMWVVNDSGWVYPATGLRVLVDNITVNADVITFDESAGGDVATDKEQCKKGGWMELTREDGSTFKNQGDCVSYTNTGR